MSQAPTAAVVDVLLGLLEAEQNSIFRFMEESSPYLSPTTLELRTQIHNMAQASHRHAQELASLIQSLGGTPPPRTVTREDQYLAYLSLKFVVPKLIEAKKMMIRRYQNAQTVLADASSQINDLLSAHLDEHRSHLRILESSVAQQKK